MSKKELVGGWVEKEVKMMVKRGRNRKYLLVMIGEKKYVMQEVEKFWGEEKDEEEIGF